MTASRDTARTDREGRTNEAVLLGLLQSQRLARLVSFLHLLRQGVERPPRLTANYTADSRQWPTRLPHSRNVRQQCGASNLGPLQRPTPASPSVPVLGDSSSSPIFKNIFPAMCEASEKPAKAEHASPFSCSTQPRHQTLWIPGAARKTGSPPEVPATRSAPGKTPRTP